MSWILIANTTAYETYELMNRIRVLGVLSLGFVGFSYLFRRWAKKKIAQSRAEKERARTESG